MNNNTLLDITYQDYINYLNSKFKYYPECKLKELIKTIEDKKLNKYYCNMNSDMQIKTLIKIPYKIKNISIKNYSSNIINRLLNIICKNTTIDIYYDVLNKIKSSKNDTEIYNYIKKLFWENKLQR